MRSDARCEPIGEVVDDQRVGAGIGLDRSALRQHRGHEQRPQVLRPRVAERPRQHAQLAGERLLVRQLAALRLFVREHRERRDAHDRAVHDVAELVGAQDDVERLVPRHIAQRHVDRALDRRVDDDVQAADLRERPEHGAEVGALEVEADRIARVARRRLRRRRLRCRSPVRRRGAALRRRAGGTGVWTCGARRRLCLRDAGPPAAASCTCCGAVCARTVDGRHHRTRTVSIWPSGDGSRRYDERRRSSTAPASSAATLRVLSRCARSARPLPDGREPGQRRRRVRRGR